MRQLRAISNLIYRTDGKNSNIKLLNSSLASLSYLTAIQRTASAPSYHGTHEEISKRGKACQCSMVIKNRYLALWSRWLSFPYSYASTKSCRVLYHQRHFYSLRQALLRLAPKSAPVLGLGNGGKSCPHAVICIETARTFHKEHGVFVFLLTGASGSWTGTHTLENNLINRGERVQVSISLHQMSPWARHSVYQHNKRLQHAVV